MITAWATEMSVPEMALPTDDPIYLPGLLREAGLVTSGGEGRRLLGQGGVRCDGQRLESEYVPRAELEGKVLQVGKRRFLRLR